MLRRTILTLPLVTLALPAAAEPSFTLAGHGRLRPAGRVNGWLVLRDAQAPARAEDHGILLARVQRPVAPAERPGHLAAVLRAFRPFRFGALPAATDARLSGLPATTLETAAFSPQTGQRLTLRATAIYAPDRSFLFVAAAPEGQWADLRGDMAGVLNSFRPGR